MPTVRTQSPSAGVCRRLLESVLPCVPALDARAVGRQAASRHRPGARLVNEGEAEPGSSPKKSGQWLPAVGNRSWESEEQEAGNRPRQRNMNLPGGILGAPAVADT